MSAAGKETGRRERKNAESNAKSGNTGNTPPQNGLRLGVRNGGSSAMSALETTRDTPKKRGSASGMLTGREAQAAPADPGASGNIEMITGLSVRPPPAGKDLRGSEEKSTAVNREMTTGLGKVRFGLNAASKSAVIPRLSDRARAARMVVKTGIIPSFDPGTEGQEARLISGKDAEIGA